MAIKFGPSLRAKLFRAKLFGRKGRVQISTFRGRNVVEFYDSAFLNLQKGKECNRTDLIAYANYEYGRLRFILAPLRGKINLGRRPQNKISVPFRDHFQKVRRAPP